jgi:hypothetical protein
VVTLEADTPLGKRRAVPVSEFVSKPSKH